MKMQLTPQQRDRLAAIRKEALANDHVLARERVTAIEAEIRQWPCVAHLPQDAKFFETFDLFDASGRKLVVQTWRGLCHWLWLRHGCVHGMLFTPAAMVVVQRRASSVADSPGYLDMTFAGHIGTQEVFDAAQSEAKQEVNVDISAGSGHVADVQDLKPIAEYDYVEPARPNEEFYNAERRYVYTIRVTAAAMGVLKPLDLEVGSFLLAPADEAWALLRAQDVASALRVSGPVALYHATRNWGWGV
jgi:hypothetical protein